MLSLQAVEQPRTSWTQSFNKLRAMANERLGGKKSGGGGGGGVVAAAARYVIPYWERLIYTERLYVCDRVVANRWVQYFPR